MSDDAQQTTLRTGVVVDDRYTIDRELGRGGFAVVYEARHRDLGRRAALKVIELPSHPGAVDPFIDRFLQEAQIAANLNHPNVVTVYDYGVIDDSGRPYLAMEYLDGHDLEMRLARGGSFSPRKAVELIIPVLDALDLAQQRGIVHKDLKPSNLYVVDEGTARERLVLLDFGIARRYEDDDSRLTQTGGFTGTPAYFAPEYVQHQLVTPAIDVYQSALILVEMITGVPVVQASAPMQYLLKHCGGDYELPEFLTDSALGPVLDEALAIDHSRRYPDCGAFRRALEAIDVSGIVAAPVEQSGRPAIREQTLERSPTTDEHGFGTSHHVSAEFEGGEPDEAPDEAATSVPSVPSAHHQQAPSPDTGPEPSRGRRLLIVGTAVLAVLFVVAAIAGMRLLGSTPETDESTADDATTVRPTAPTGPDRPTPAPVARGEDEPDPIEEPAPSPSAAEMAAGAAEDELVDGEPEEAVKEEKAAESPRRKPVRRVLKKAAKKKAKKVRARKARARQKKRDIAPRDQEEPVEASDDSGDRPLDLVP